MAKVALLIGVSEYEPGLTPLPAALRDVEALQRVLQDPELGGFDTVKTLLNPDPGAMQLEVETLVTEQCSRNDLVLLYFSGHGIRDDSGNLYFATRITRKNANGDLIRATAVPARAVNEILHSSRIKRQAIILDCCYSGAFDPALRKDDGSVDLREQLGAEGRVVLASSDSTQYSQVQAGADLSLYTHYLVEGIETGAGDLNEDGQISAQELHHYAFDRVRAAAPNMTPKLITLKDLGFEIVLSKAKVTDPRLRYRKTVARYVDGETLRPSGRAVLDTLRQQLNLTIAEAEEIEAEVFQPYRERLANIQKYRSTLRLEAEHQYPLDDSAKDALEALRQLLGLRAEDIAPIEQEIQTEFVSLADQTAPELLQKQTPQSAETDFTEIPASLSAERAYEFFALGLANYNAGNFQEAIAAQSEGLLLRPDAGVYFARGHAKSQIGDLKGAIPDYDEAIRLQPNDAATYFVRGHAKSQIGDLKGAILDYDDAIRLQPNDARFYQRRGTVKFELGDMEGTITDCNETIRLNPGIGVAYYNRGTAKYSLGDEQGSIIDYDEAIRLGENDANTYIRRGLAKSDLGEKQAAIVDYDTAIRLEPDHYAAYYNRGLAQFSLGNLKGAIADFDVMIRLRPDNADAYFSRGGAKSMIGDKKEAILDYSEVIRLRPDDADTYFIRGRTKSDLGDKEGAIADYDEALFVKPDYADAYVHRGRMKYELGDKKGAIGDYTAAIRLNPDYGGIVYMLRGSAKYHGLSDKQGAITDFRESARLFQQQGDVENYRWVMNQIEKLEKRFLGGLFS